MAQRFVDSFAHYPISLITKKWTSTVSTGTNTIVTGVGGRSAIRLVAGSLLRKTLVYAAGWTVGWRIKIEGINNNFGEATLFELDSNGTRLLTLLLHADGTLSFYPGDGSGDPTFATTTLSIHADTWYYFEVQLTFGTYSSTYISVSATLKINGNIEMTGSAAHTGISYLNLVHAAAEGNVIVLSSCGKGFTSIMDLYANDNTTANNNSYNGDIKIIAIYPNGDVLTPWGGGTPHFSKINEHSPDDDSTYIHSNTPGDIDVWDWDDIPTFTGTIPGVQYLLYARKDDEGTRSVKHNTGVTGLESEGTEQFLGDDYLYYINEYDLDPNGDIPWTVANFNAKRFGIKLQA